MQLTEFFIFYGTVLCFFFVININMFLLILYFLQIQKYFTQPNQEQFYLLIYYYLQVINQIKAISKANTQQMKTKRQNFYSRDSKRKHIKPTSKQTQKPQQQKTKIIYVKQTLQQAIQRVKKQQQFKKNNKKNTNMDLASSQMSKFSLISNSSKHTKPKYKQHFIGNGISNSNYGTLNEQQKKKLALLSISQSKQTEQFRIGQKLALNFDLLIKPVQNDQEHATNKDINLKQTNKEQTNLQNPEKIEQRQTLKQSQLKLPEAEQNNLTPQQNKIARKSHKTQFSNNKITTRSCRSLFNAKQPISKSMSQRLQQKQREAKQKIMKNKIQLLQSQTKFKLQKKIKQNLQLNQKKELLSQFFYNKLEWQKQKDDILKKKRQEQRLLHQSSQMKIQMLKKLKKKAKKRQLQECRSKSEESLLNLQFSKIMTQKQKQQKKDILVQRYRFLKNKNKSLINFRSETSKSNRFEISQSHKKTFLKTARQNNLLSE